MSVHTCILRISSHGDPVVLVIKAIGTFQNVTAPHVNTINSTSRALLPASGGLPEGNDKEALEL